MKEYKLTNGVATVYEGKSEIEPVIKRFVKNKKILKNILNQWCLTHNCKCDLCILFKSNKTNYYLAIFRNQWENALGVSKAKYSLCYGNDYIRPMHFLNFSDLINEFFEKNEEFILPYQKSFLEKIKNYDTAFIPLLTKNNDLISGKILRRYFWFSGRELSGYIEIDGVGNYVLHYNEVSKKHFIYATGRYTEVQMFFDNEQAINYCLNILTNRIDSKKRQIEDLGKRINKIKSVLNS